MDSVIVKTRDGVYEVRETDKLFRRLAPGAPDEPSWAAYDRLSPVEPGEPARFFVVHGERGRVLHYRVITTSPVVEVLRATA